MQILLTAAMVVEAVFGLGFTLAPDMLLGRMGVTLIPASDGLARLFGTALLSLTLLLWLARRSESAPLRRGAALTLLAYYLLSGACFLALVLGGVLNSMGWGAVLLHLFFAAWCGWVLAKKRG